MLGGVHWIFSTFKMNKNIIFTSITWSISVLVYPYTSIYWRWEWGWGWMWGLQAIQASK